MNNIIDLRSDTVTTPTPGMLDAMMSAKVGDDVFAEDPTVKALEEKTAALFGKEAGIFCPSGTMTNQIAIKCFTNPMDELICDASAHIYNYEGGGIAFNSSVSARLVQGNRGRITANDVLDNINPDNIHHPKTSLVVLENTSNRGGGSYYDINEIKAIRKVCDEHKLFLHLDGARIFNALIAGNTSAAEHGKLFDGISVCLSKGLGAPVGSVLLGTKAMITQARRVRKVFGGGMRQAGFLAAAGIYALDNNVNRMVEDHRRAKELGAVISNLNYVESLIPVETNIVIFKLKAEMPSEKFIQKMLEQGIKVSPFGKQMIRMVTHLQFDDDMLAETIKGLKGLLV